MAIKPPCYGCTERKVGCHGNCEGYAEFQKKVQKQNENRKKEDVFIDFKRSKDIKIQRIIHNKKG